MVDCRRVLTAQYRRKEAEKAEAEAHAQAELRAARAAQVATKQHFVDLQVCLRWVGSIVPSVIVIFSSVHYPY